MSARRLSLFGVVEWVLGAHRDGSRVTVNTLWDEPAAALFADNPLSAFPARRAFFTATGDVRSATGDRAEFFGVAGSRARPAALGRAALSGRAGPRSPSRR